HLSPGQVIARDAVPNRETDQTAATSKYISAGSSLELEETCRLLRKRESEFLQQLSEVPEDQISQENKETFRTTFNVFFPALLCEIAGSDGPINQREAEVINRLTGRTKNSLYYNQFFQN